MADGCGVAVQADVGCWWCRTHPDRKQRKRWATHPHENGRGEATPLYGAKWANSGFITLEHIFSISSKRVLTNASYADCVTKSFDGSSAYAFTRRCLDMSMPAALSRVK